jgi:hypothetical protein
MRSGALQKKKKNRAPLNSGSKEKAKGSDIPDVVLPPSLPIAINFVSTNYITAMIAQSV